MSETRVPIFMCDGSPCDPDFESATVFFGRHSDLFTADIQLELYALFKQATAGDCQAPAVGCGTKRTVMIEAWRSKSGVSSSDAQKHYVGILDSACPNWRNHLLNATNPDFPDDEYEDLCASEPKGSVSTWAAGSVPVGTIGDAGEVDETVAGQLCHLAAEGNLAALKEVLSKDPSLVSAKDTDGMTCLHWASDRGNMDVAKFLISAKADINAQDLCQNTPLHIAAMACQKQLVRLLLDAKADVSVVNVDGDTVAAVIKREFPAIVLA